MTLRDLERDSIRAFVQQAASEGYLSGRVLDYGCGQQPYRDIVEAAGGEYSPFDRLDHPANVSGRDYGGDADWHGSYDAVLCTQVVQYVADVPDFFSEIRYALDNVNRSRWLVLTYPTNWPEVEPEDLHRFTKAGMERLLTEAGFTIVMHQRRGDPKLMVCHEEILGRRVWASEYTLGYGVVAKA